jgi:V8-like Glu-specific endopeptidase
MKKISFVLALVFSTTLTLNAAPPDIGDNSFFECVEVESSREPGMCFGDISWVADKDGESKFGQSLRIKRAKKILNNAIKFFTRQEKIALSVDDIELADEFVAKKTNAIQSKEDLGACYFEYFDTCTGVDDGGDGDGNFPGLVEACNLISSPTTYGEIQRSRTSKFIVNGRVCSETGAATSPVIKILLDGSQHCTGTYVAANTILTAAHCLESTNCSDLTVENSTASQSIGATECIIHPGYNQGSIPQQNDVGIIKLASDFTGITPAKVNTVSAEVGDDAAFAGYGRNEKDDTKLRATFNQISEVTTEVISTLFTRGEKNEGTTCNGDSGGPLFVFSGGEWKTQGTLSDGSAADCALPGTDPNSDTSNWANLVDPANQSFIRDNTNGVLD